jgi:glycosyltransferase involved in cell wall biosynthesis
MRTKPVICQLLHSLRMGGAEVLAARLARRLGDRFRFVFACLDELGSLGAELRREGFVVEIIGRRPGIDWRCSLRLARWLKGQCVDVLHAYQYTPFFYGAAARLLWRRPALLFAEHGRTHPDYPRRKRMFANRLLLERRDRVVSVGEAVRQALVHNEGIAPGRVAVIYNGIDLAAHANGVCERLAAREEIGVGPADFVALQVARLDPVKDHATALRALEAVIRQRPDARLVLVGDGPELPHIREIIRQYALTAHVHLLGQRGDVARLLPAADVCLLTSIGEGIPLTLIEAMAAGLPVVTTEVGGAREVVGDETGLLAPAGDHVRLAEHLLQLAADPALRRQLGQRGRARAAARFSEEQMVDNYARLYREMLHA